MEKKCGRGTHEEIIYTKIVEETQTERERKNGANNKLIFIFCIMLCTPFIRDRWQTQTVRIERNVSYTGF